VTGRQWIRSAILGATIAIAAPGRLIAQAPQPPNAELPDEAAKKDLDQQQQILNDRNSTAQQREEAARRLVSRSSKDANEILLRLLTDFSNPQGQMAVARALAWSTSPSASFINPLANLLGSDRDMTAAAAAALAVYKTDEGAREKLTAFVNNLSQQVGPRVAAILAMGKLVDKRAAGSLIGLMNRENENSLVRDATADALIEMTGLSRFGRDVQQWNQWWQASQSRSEAGWSTDLLNKNAARASELYNQLQKDQRFIAKMVREEYNDKKTPEAEREKKLLGHMQADSEGARLAAVQVIYEEATQFGGARISAPVLAALRGMVGNSSTEVRVRVARTLTTANDPGAVDALLAQLSQEKDADVQAAILQALGPSHDLRAVDPLLTRLTDPSFSVARAAAEALRDLAGTLREEQNAALAVQVAIRLRDRLKGTENVSAARLRESIVDAMARLGQRSSLPVFYELLNPGKEPARIRIAALRGLGLIGDHGSANMVVNTLNDSQPGVRLAAAEALLTTATFENAKGIASHLSETVERDPDVRAAIWKVIAALLEKASANEVLVWAEQFKQEGDSDPALNRRATALGIAEKKLAATNDPLRLAVVRQNLGETLLKLNKADEAVEKLREALDYWTNQRADEAVINLPRQQLMEALLRSKKYNDAATFATTLIGQNKATTPDMWVKVSHEIKRLRDRRDSDGAMSLIEVVKTIPWGELYSSQLKLLEDQIRKERTTGGRTWVPQANGHEHAAASSFTAT
jgi:HEAT repeat protein